MKKAKYFNIVLYRPLIPPNTGNIVRLCVGTECRLHLIGRLGFDIDDKAVRRAGLDYWENLDMRYYENLDEFLKINGDKNIWLITKFGNKLYTDVYYELGDFIMFGQETKGLPEELHKRYPDKRLSIPMHNNVRSINLSNSVAIVLYEAIRQKNITLRLDNLPNDTNFYFSS